MSSGFSNKSHQLGCLYPLGAQLWDSDTDQQQVLSDHFTNLLRRHPCYIQANQICYHASPALLSLARFQTATNWKLYPYWYPKGLELTSQWILSLNSYSLPKHHHAGSSLRNVVWTHHQVSPLPTWQQKLFFSMSPIPSCLRNIIMPLSMGQWGSALNYLLQTGKVIAWDHHLVLLLVRIYSNWLEYITAWSK